MASSYTQLEGNLEEQVYGGRLQTFDASQPVSTYMTFNFLYVSAITLIIAASAVMYIIAGAWRIEASERGIRKSDETFKRVTLGLIGVLSLFTILYTVNKDLLLGDVGLDKLKASVAAGTGSVVPKSTSTPPATNTNYQARVASHQAVVARLAPSNIHTNHNDQPCTEAQFAQSTPSCTSLAFLPEQTIQLLLAINGSCHCTLVVTGATEPGHAVNGNHGEGKRAVDLRISSSQNTSDPLYSFIKSVGSPFGANNGASTSCYARYLWRGYTFCDEKPRGNSTWDPHFHVD